MQKISPWLNINCINEQVSNTGSGGPLVNKTIYMYYCKDFIILLQVVNIYFGVKTRIEALILMVLKII